jgi:hypothetical protein
MIASRHIRSSLIAHCSLLLVLTAGCNRDGGKIILNPPFDGKAKVGEVTATWQATGEERAFAEGRKLATPEVRLQYRVDLRNRLADKMFLRLADFRLTNKSGAELGKDTARVECVLAVGDSSGVLRGDVWVPKDSADDVDGFGLTHLAIPLSEIGQGHYREWMLQGRKGDAASVDAEIAGYAAAPACPRG